MNGAGEDMSAKQFYFDENNNYKDKYNYTYFKWFLMRGSYSGLSTNMTASGTLPITADIRRYEVMGKIYH